MGVLSGKQEAFFSIILLIFYAFANHSALSQSYEIVGTNQTIFYDNSAEILAPSTSQAFYGQDAMYPGNIPSYTDHGDGTVTDNVTGLMWQQSADLNGDGTINVADKFSYQSSLIYADTLALAGYTDWRLPTIKELYSLILFSGLDISGPNPTVFVPFIDDEVFEFGYGDESAGERLIDAQYASLTLYVSTSMGGMETMFGVNFADGRIKGYPLTMPGVGDKLFYVKCVRGGQNYGVNSFSNNGNGTISDNSTGLMWTQDDNGEPLSWEEALEHAETSVFAGYTDWRLPDAKELQSIVDYTRSPATTSSSAIDPLFNCSQITDEGGNLNFPFCWTSTTHASVSSTPGEQAVYVCFGEALGWMEEPPMSGNYTLMDVHGAGAQRCDFKTGDPGGYPYGFGPQGDVVRIKHYVRLVRDIASSGTIEKTEKTGMKIYPNPNDGNFKVMIPNDTDKIEITTITGQPVLMYNPHGLITLDLTLPQNGIYSITAMTETLMQTVKVIVAR
ncbi:MAG: DUF1566 domain-containing protein [Bacteroidetes bacterium]|nr:DUF1566 domain-containing protein [Bacteroidota bacterium]